MIQQGLAKKLSSGSTIASIAVAIIILWIALSFSSSESSYTTRNGVKIKTSQSIQFGSSELEDDDLGRSNIDDFFWPNVKETSIDEEKALDDESSGIASTNTMLTHRFEPPDYDPQKGEIFSKQWCKFKKLSWYPKKSDSWQLRAPYFILPGAKKSGTTSLSSYLMQHPLIEKARVKELQFFLDKNFKADYTTPKGKTRVDEARLHLYNVDYHSTALKSENNFISFDGTPEYFFRTNGIPQRILCVTPWIKVVIILRNPVERAYSNWAFAMRRLKKNATFEVYSQYDLNLLKDEGVLSAANAEEEKKAWDAYLSHPTEGVVGRSLYVIQIREWFQAFQDSGRDPRTQFYFLRSENIKRDLQGEMQKLHSFLGLPYVPVVNEGEKVVTHYTEPMRNDTKAMLESLYDPYNKRFYKLLVEYGFGDDWHGIWDSP
jgi:Sulfotransferase domain